MRAKQIIQDRIISPSNHIDNRYTTTAKVVRADETSNMCLVEYRDKDGYRAHAKAPVRLYNKGVIDWFPEPGELVTIEDREGTIHIVSQAANYSRDIKSRSKLKHDIYSDNSTDTICGSIF